MEMRRWKIYVEGIADQRFIQHYIQFITEESCPDQVVFPCGGFSKLTSEAVINDMKKNTDEGIKNLVIFDADESPDGRRSEIEHIREDNHLDFDLFLFPDNRNAGALEELLMQCINPVNRCVVDCWNRYENDLAEQTIGWKTPPKPTIPASKTKVYAYLEALVGSTKEEKKLIKERERNYLNPNHWNLGHMILNPLKEFLKKNGVIS